MLHCSNLHCRELSLEYHKRCLEDLCAGRAQTKIKRINLTNYFISKIMNGGFHMF